MPKTLPRATLPRARLKDGSTTAWAGVGALRRDGARRHSARGATSAWQDATSSASPTQPPIDPRTHAISFFPLDLPHARKSGHFGRLVGSTRQI